MIKVSPFVLSIAGEALNEGMATIVNSGVKRLYSSSDCGRMNILRMK